VDQSEKLRREILRLVAKYYDEALSSFEFTPGETPVPVAGRTYDAEDLVHLVDASLDFWLTAGRFAAQFEREFARYMKVRHAILCNSGSSANLLALSALTSSRLRGKRLKPGDEVITVAAGFPTTVNPIFQNDLVPVFLDIELETCNIDTTDLERAITPRTRAIMIAHTLGNPFDLDAVVEVTKQHNLWLIEDNCDALGTTYKGKLTGSFGDLATSSFYPAHHITMGEGGCVLTNRPTLKVIVESFRDWGRDCWCEPGKDNTCGKRFAWKMGDLPEGYDHKYIYSHIGFNLKVTDMQAAIGVSQLKKLPHFTKVRKRNWQLLYDGLKQFEEYLILPRATAGSDPSWFGFVITVRPGAPFTRNEMVRYLESRKVATRLLFSGNLTRQPAYRDQIYRVVGELKNTNIATDQTFWIGVYPGVTEPMTDYAVDVVAEFIQEKTGK